MIYRREEYMEEGGENDKFPVRHIDAMIPVGEGKKRFVGSVTLGLQTPLGMQQMPVSFEIDADNIQEAFSRFEAAAEPKIEEARKGIEEEINRLRRDASSRIVTPGEVGLGGMGAAGRPGGKIINLKNLK